MLIPAALAARPLAVLRQLRLPALILCAGLLAILTLSGHRAVAADNAVDCADLSISFDAKSGYELNCTEKTLSLAGMDGSYEEQRLQATATDGTTFVDAFHDTLMGRVILTGTDLRNNLQDFYGHLAVKDWQSGRALSNWSTAEFTADMRGLPSHCVAFQKLAHHEWDGYKKIMIGVSCSQDSVDLAYEAAKHLYLPN